jgi:hypothetical protein
VGRAEEHLQDAFVALGVDTFEMLLRWVVLATSWVEKLLTVSVGAFKLGTTSRFAHPTCSLVKQSSQRYFVNPTNLVEILQISGLNFREPQDTEQVNVFLVSGFLGLIYLLQYLWVEAPSLTYLTDGLRIRS